MNMLKPDKTFSFILTLFILLLSFSAKADISHYKEILVGDRGANLAGAYSAVADDSSGAYYNPAGLSFGAKDAMTGISNATNFVYNEYKNMVNTESEQLEGWRYLITFVGYMKRVDNSVFGLSYVIDDSTEVHQDQVFDNGLTKNRRGDDRTYKYGPSWAYQLSDNFSWGVSLFVYQREYYNQISRLMDKGDDSSEWDYEYIEGADFGYHIKTGLMWGFSEDVALSLVLKKTIFTHSESYAQSSVKAPNEAKIESSKTSETGEFRKTPLGITMGWAWFVSQYVMVAADLDYYLIDDEDKVNVLNLSAGIEYYINEKNVIRGGLYTNYDNDQAPDSSTTGVEKIDMVGMALGYSLFNGPTMITIGAVASYGKGKAQMNPEIPNEIQDSVRETYSFSLAVSYNID